MDGRWPVLTQRNWLRSQRTVPDLNSADSSKAQMSVLCGAGKPEMFLTQQTGFLELDAPRLTQDSRMHWHQELLLGTA